MSALNNTLTAVPSKRNYGIDLLRVVSMLMVAVLHILGHGGILKNTAVLSFRYEAAWFLEIAAYCAVNCYALISGYVGVNSKFKYTNIFYIWLQVAFYNVLINFVGAAVLPNMGVKEVLRAFLPVSYRTYWYFTAYFCMFFFLPIINKGLNALNKKQLLALVGAIFGILCLIPLIPEWDIFVSNNGYSAIWLLSLYIFGGAIKKAELFSKAKAIVMLLMYFVMIALTWLHKLYVDYHNLNFPNEEKLEALLVKYTSPTILLSAVFLVAFFSKLKVAPLWAKVIGVIAPVSFGVYLIHENPVVRENIVRKAFVEFPKFGPIKLVLCVLGCALAIYIICGLIDYLRERLFKLLRVKKLLMWLEQKLTKNLWNE